MTMDRNKMFDFEHSMGKNSAFPPPATQPMDIEFEAFEPEKGFIHIKGPIKEAYYNPGGVVFGGYYGMFFDAAFGPFSFLLTKGYVTTLEMNISFLKPLRVKDGYWQVEATLINQSKSFLMMEGKAYREDRTLVATATTRMMILDPKR